MFGGYDNGTSGDRNNHLKPLLNTNTQLIEQGIGMDGPLNASLLIIITTKVIFSFKFNIPVVILMLKHYHSDIYHIPIWHIYFCLKYLQLWHKKPCYIRLHKDFHCCEHKKVTLVEFVQLFSTVRFQIAPCWVVTQLVIPVQLSAVSGCTETRQLISAV